MDSIFSALNRLEQGQGTQQDQEYLASFVRRALPYAGVQASAQASFMADQSLYNLVHAMTEIASGLDIDQIAQVTVAKIAQFMPVDSCALIGAEPASDQMVLLGEQVSEDWEIPFRWPASMMVDEFPCLGGAIKANAPAQIWAGQAGTDEDVTNFLQKAGVEIMLLVPFSLHGQSTGLIALLFRQPAHPLSPNEMVILHLLASQAAVSIENARLYSNAWQRTLELEAVHQASLTLTASLDLQHVLNAILQSTLALIKNAENGHIFLFDGDQLEFGAAMWSNGQKNQPWSHPRKDGLTYTVAQQGEILQVADMSNHPLYHSAPSTWRGSIIGLPLKIEKRVVGVMNVARKEPAGFSDSEIRVLRLLGDQAALAIENARLHDVISQQALTDALTELPNRRAFDNRLAEEISRSMRYRHQFALMMIDLNSFKEINDTFGHPTGDEVLKQVATLLHRSLHDTDFLARYGGDEFALILPETRLAGAQALSNRLQRLLLASRFEMAEDEKRVVTACIGYAIFPEEATNATELVAASDRMLYQFKHQQLAGE